MFSKRLLTILCLIVLLLINIILLSAGPKYRHSNTMVDKIVMAGIAPLQEGVMQSIRFCEHIWSHYFYLIGVRQECDQLTEALAKAKLEKSQHVESKHTCQRLHKLLEIKDAYPKDLLPAQIVGLDPSGWFKSIVINRGTYDGLAKGMPVMAPEGVVGQVVSTSYHYSKVMLIIDRSSAIDALIQRTRARGIVVGETDEYCRFKYVLRKADVRVGDTVVSSGLDGLFPKGLRIGSVKEVSKSRPGIFDAVTVVPFVDFARLEEILVILE